MILPNWQGVYIHIERRELKAGDDVNGNNEMEGDANNRSNVCTSCTNDDNVNKYGHVLMSIACSSTVRSGMRLVDQGVIH